MNWFAHPRAGAVLRGWDSGVGVPVVFQHGLGGDEAQVAEVFPDSESVRRLTLECRGQGGSVVGDPQQFSIAVFAEDVITFADSCGVERFIVGGISMGAAIALRIAVRHPERVMALILARPAWLWDAAPANMQAFSVTARYLKDADPQRGLANFEDSALALELARKAPDNLESLRKFFAWENCNKAAALLAAIASDGPGVNEADVGAIEVPALVIGHAIDVIHPLALAQRLSTKIAGSQFIEVTPKATDRQQYTAEFRDSVAEFLTRVSNCKGKRS